MYRAMRLRTERCRGDSWQWLVVSDNTLWHHDGLRRRLARRWSWWPVSSGSISDVLRHAQNMTGFD